MGSRGDQRGPRRTRSGPLTMEQAMAASKWDLVTWLEERARAAEHERRRLDARRRSTGRSAEG